jgi:hypothetical protein
MNGRWQKTVNGDGITRLRAEYKMKFTEGYHGRHRTATAGRYIFITASGVSFSMTCLRMSGTGMDGSPAYENLSEEKLCDAIEIADEMLEEGLPSKC